MKKRHEQAQGGKQGDCDAFSGPVGHVLAEGSLVPVGPPWLPACSAVCRVSAGQEGRYLVVPPGKPRWSPRGTDTQPTHPWSGSAQIFLRRVSPRAAAAQR